MVKRNVMVREITPIVASVWLAKQGPQRAVSKHHVHSLAEIIRRGEWSEHSADLIQISTEGVVLNGQHRLLAIIEADISVMAMVEVDVPKESIYDQDQGKRRSIADLLRIDGETHCTILASILRYMYAYERKAMLDSTIAKGWTYRSAKDILCLNPAIRESARYANGDRTMRLLSPPAALGFFHFLTYARDAAMAEDFHRSLGSGVGLFVGHPILTLRNWLLRQSRQSGRRNGSCGTTGMVDRLAAMFKAWSA